LGAGGGEQAPKKQEDAEQHAAVVVPPLRQLLSAELKVYLERIRWDTTRKEGHMTPMVKKTIVLPPAFCLLLSLLSKRHCPF